MPQALSQLGEEKRKSEEQVNQMEAMILRVAAETCKVQLFKDRDSMHFDFVFAKTFNIQRWVENGSICKGYTLVLIVYSISNICI